jgi:surface protein
MSNIIFPEGVTWTQRYMTGGDILTSGDSVPIAGNLYYSAKNQIIKVGFDTSKTTIMSSMFQNCTDLLDLLLFDTSGATNMYNMFVGCNSLTTIPKLDTSNVTTMNYMLQNCTKLTSIPLLDTSKVTSMNYMFSGCNSLTTIPKLDTSNVTNMTSMFQSCRALTTIPQLDTSNVTNMSSMFYDCSKLTSIPLLDCGKISAGSYINLFSSNTMTYLTDLGGFKDLGKVSSFNKPSYFLKVCPNLTKESVLNVLNNLYDRKTAGYSVVTLPFHTNSLALLSDDEKAIATNKGWTLATS